jgi:hypothetical protein
VHYTPFTYFKRIFHVKIQLFVPIKSDQDPDPDPHGSALVWLRGTGSASESIMKPMRIHKHNTEFNSPSHHRPKIRHRSRRGKDWAWLTRTDQIHPHFSGR